MTALIENSFYDQYYKGLKPGGQSSKYYVVFKGREIGIFDTWEETKKQTDGFSGVSHKSFKTYPEAERALKQYLDNKQKN